MMIELGDNSLRSVVMITFLAGFFCGYKAKEWKLWWFRRKRDKLASKLAETQKKIDVM